MLIDKSPSVINTAALPVLWLTLAVSRIERPAIAPTHVKRTFSAVKVTTDTMLLGIAAREAAVFPSRGKRLKFVDGNLRIRRVGGLLLVGQNSIAADGTTTGRVDPAGILLVRPPQHLIEPMDSPIAKRSVGKIEEIAKAAGVNLAVERA